MSEAIVGGAALVVSIVLLWASAAEVGAWKNGASWLRPNPPESVNRKRRSGSHPKRSMTPVMGTILMVAITVALAAGLYLMVSGLSSP